MRVVYALTPVGRTLIPHLLGLVTWASGHHEEIDANRLAFDRSKRDAHLDWSGHFTRMRYDHGCSVIDVSSSTLTGSSVTKSV